VIDMELRHLRYFVAIAEERSITRAAERLWVAQPGLSTQMRRLEAELGIKLFERHSRGVELTDAGELFLERARTALAAAEVARSTGSNLEAGLLGTVRLGIATETPSRVVPSLLAGFAGYHPDVEVTVLESYGGTLLRDLRDGRLDAVLTPSILGSAEFRHLQLGSEPWVVLVGLGHRLAESGPIAGEDLQGEQIVVTGHRDGAAYDRAVADMLTELGVTPVLERGGPGPALFTAVAAGAAVALTTAGEARGGEMLVRPLEPARRVGFTLLWRDETLAPPLNELIRAAGRVVDPVAPATRPTLAVAA
jgi:DNA-binding transcriptional LysR family regulator